jgi:hypothetical protein
LLLAFSENGLNVLFALKGLRVVAIGEIGEWGFKAWNLIIVNMAASGFMYQDRLAITRECARASFSALIISGERSMAPESAIASWMACILSANDKAETIGVVD